jgi:hypothetical protein
VQPRRLQLRLGQPPPESERCGRFHDPAAPPIRQLVCTSKRKIPIAPSANSPWGSSASCPASFKAEMVNNKLSQNRDIRPRGNWSRQRRSASRVRLRGMRSPRGGTMLREMRQLSKSPARGAEQGRCGVSACIPAPAAAPAAMQGTGAVAAAGGRRKAQRRARVIHALGVRHDRRRPFIRSC